MNPATDRKIAYGCKGSFGAGRSVRSPVTHLAGARDTDSDRLLVRAVERGSAGEFAIGMRQREAPVAR